MHYERSSRGLFYLVAFFMSYQIATLFQDVRNTFGPVRDYILEHKTDSFDKRLN